jgi:5'-deoxynucleotidase YfbR-like HD superfamily hydrolase
MLPQEMRKDYWEVLADFRDQESVEARIVRVADKLEALLQSLEYERSGHTHGLTEGMLREAEEAAKACDNKRVNDLVEEILTHFSLLAVKEE